MSKLFCHANGETFCPEDFRLPMEAEEGELLPLKRRLQRLARGRPGEKACSAALVRRLADMPLGEYLRDFPEEREELYRSIPSLNRADATYLDAAHACFCLSMGRSERPPELQGVFAERDDILDILACPMVFAGQDEDEDGEAQPPRKLTVKPLARRVAELRHGTDIFPADMTISCLFEGASLLSGSLFPERLLERFIDEYRGNHVDERTCVMNLLSHAQRLREDNPGNDPLEDREYAQARRDVGTDLYICLLIEPFQLIYQSRKEKSK